MLLQYGGVTVMFPIALLIAGWLWQADARAACRQWLITVVGCYFLVGFSKVLFKGWGIGLPELGIAVFSGHAMNITLMIPVLASLLARQFAPGWRWPMAAVGIAFGWWFSVTLVAHRLHPLPEAIGGAVIGSSAALGFLWLLEHSTLRTLPRAYLALGVVLLALAASAPKVTAERMLDRFATSLSGAAEPFTHEDLHGRRSAL
jgi:hypothetical protein